MTINQPTRRHFIGAAGALAAGLMLPGCTASATPSSPDELSSDQQDIAVATICELCPNRCGVTAVVREHKLVNVLADGTHPNTRGSLCACGYTLPDIVYADSRVTEPKKRIDRDSWETVSWDQTIQEVAASLTALKRERGAGCIALIHDGRPTNALYGKKFAHALGSPHVIDATQQGSRVAHVLERTIGSRAFYPDACNSKMILLVGQASFAGTAPRDSTMLHEASTQGARICRVSPYRSASDNGISEWIPIAPGTELAFVLALAQVIVYEELYDHEFVASFAEGFDEWKSTLIDYRPSWAETITGISAAATIRLAHDLANNAPAVSVSPGDLFDHYANSGETARTIALINALLGTWNQKGGVFASHNESFEEADMSCTPTIPDPVEEPLGNNPAALSKALENGSVRGLIVLGSGTSGSRLSALGERPETLDTLIVVDSHSTALSKQADYILPVCSVFEQTGLPSIDQGTVPLASMQKQVLNPLRPAVKPLGEVIGELARACDVGQYFDFTDEEIRAARLDHIGLSGASFEHASFAPLPSNQMVYGEAPHGATASGKIMFSGGSSEDGDLQTSAQWMEALDHPTDDQRAFRLVRLLQPTTLAPYASNQKTRSITEECGLDRALMNPSSARSLGIADGDPIEISSPETTATLMAHLSPCVHPKALLLPCACNLEEGVSPAFPCRLDPSDGASFSDETIVTVKKGASR